MPDTSWAPSNVPLNQQRVLLLPRQPKSQDDAESLLESKLRRLLSQAESREWYLLEDEYPELSHRPLREQAQELLQSPVAQQSLKAWSQPPDPSPELREEQSLEDLLNDLEL